VTDAWEQRLAAAWDELDALDEAAFRARIEALAAELPADSAAAAFERAAALDSTGHPDAAVPLYRDALAAGLPGIRRRRAVIQLASSLRNLGAVDESLRLLTAERGAATDELDDAVRAFQALALTDAGREREAVSIALGALAPHLPRYGRSLTAYAEALGAASPAVVELRDYRIRAGELDRFVAEWRRGILPIRRGLGFRVPVAWTAPATGSFLWLLSMDGDEAAFDTADVAYHASPDREALDPDPGRLIEAQTRTRVHPVALDEASG
jgi:tetratricopeptide (TPR) repeat protein